MWIRKSFYLVSISVSEIQCLFMLLLLQVCFAPAFYPVSGIEVQDGAQLFRHYRRSLSQRDDLILLRSNSVTGLVNEKRE